MIDQSLHPCDNLERRVNGKLLFNNMNIAFIYPCYDLVHFIVCVIECNLDIIIMALVEESHVLSLRHFEHRGNDSVVEIDTLFTPGINPGNGV